MRRKVSTRVFVIAAIVISLVCAGVVSYYASSSPDGLNKVAADKGFDSTEKDSATDGSPFAGYDAAGVDNERLGGAAAGVAGVAVVLLLAGGLGYVVRRRSGPTAE